MVELSETTEASARNKLAYPTTPLQSFCFQNLPTDQNDPIWTRIEATYSMSLEELSALKNARCSQDKRSVLGGFRWYNENMRDEAVRYFKINGFGKYVLKRQGVVDKVLREAERQIQVYFSGCKAMGKTSVLNLIASELNAQGWIVYFFQSANAIPHGAGAEVTANAKENRHQKIAVIVDEIATNPNSDLFFELLKGELPNVLTVGAAVPRFAPTVAFRKVFRTDDLTLKASDEDVRCLIEYWKKKMTISPDMVDHVSSFLLDHCGGHVYPVLAFMEYFFTDADAEQALYNEKKFRKYFFSQEFSESVHYREICDRCFDALSFEADSIKTLTRVLGGRAESNHISTLSCLGWWNEEERDILSALLVNAYFNNVVLPSGEKIYLDTASAPEQNLEMLIIEGLNGMELHELISTAKESRWPNENALSFHWARKVKSRIANVHLEFQKSFGSSLINFYVNGCDDCATKTVKVGSTEQSQDIDEHLRRFSSGVYSANCFALLNFAMDSKKEIVLPKDTGYLDKVYTYQHSTNSLYRGEQLIRAPAVASLFCSVPFVNVQKSGGAQRSYRTVAGRLAVGPATPCRQLLTTPTPPSLVVQGFMKLFRKF